MNTFLSKLSKLKINLFCKIFEIIKIGKKSTKKSKWNIKPTKNILLLFDLDKNKDRNNELINKDVS